jgi:hypothetical protein
LKKPLLDLHGSVLYLLLHLLLLLLSVVGL